MADTLTTDSLDLFRALAEEAVQFGDNPYLENLPPMSQSDNGNMTDLKKRGLINVCQTNYGKHMVNFTSEGIKLAMSLGINIDF